jgi:uroporphyrinogen decarboxylase
MRQAGRYLPEYRALRQKIGNFLDLCLDPKLAAEVTLQPIRRFGFDAAILFSDILVIPYALGQSVAFTAADGPRLDAITDAESLGKLRKELDHQRLAPVYETIARVKSQLPPHVTLLGFCGAPWTVATYMIAGAGTPDQIPAREFVYRAPSLLDELLDILVEASASYLIRQFEAGAEAVQIFDTWAGVLPDDAFDRCCIEPCARIVAAVRARIPSAKFIGFPRGAGSRLKRYIDGVGINAVGLDWMIDLGFARDEVQSRKPVQGNLDPVVLLAGGDALDRAVDRIIENFAAGPFIFNLGHGVLPDTPVAHVEQLVRRVRASS